MPDRPV